MYDKRKKYPFFVLEFILFFFLFPSCSSLLYNFQNTNEEKKLDFYNQNFSNLLGTVSLNNNIPFKELRSGSVIDLEFDMLSLENNNFQAKFIHCNADWTPSVLSDLQFSEGINRFYMTNIQFSKNTVVPYISYATQLKCPKISGNFLVVVYQNNNSNDFLFARRIVIYKNIITIAGDIRLPRNLALKKSSQLLDVKINTQSISILNAAHDLKMVVMQNYDWKKSWHPKNPTYSNPSQKVWEWKPLDNSNLFWGWNEFRFLDIRTLRLKSVFIQDIYVRDSALHVHLKDVANMSKNTYNELIKDNNGLFEISNLDLGSTQGQLEYANVHFILNSSRFNGNIYIVGAFNGWQRNEKNKMKYDEKSKNYFCDIVLKQGYYDFRFEVEDEGTAPHIFEGSWVQTENDYHILVYYRDPHSFADEVIGYQKINSRSFF